MFAFEAANFGCDIIPGKRRYRQSNKYDTNDVIRSGFFLLLRRNGESLDKAYFLLAKLIAGPPPVLNFADVRW